MKNNKNQKAQIATKRRGIMFIYYCPLLDLPE